MNAVLPGMKGRAVGELFLRQFIDLVNLAPEETVLEPGCGTGRMAEPLTRYLTGTYDGFDVVRETIEWCRKNIRQPNFRFRHVDVRNRFYNPEGTLDPVEFEFPYPDKSFDFVFLTSVFTHMLPPEVEHYLTEIRRVLRGRCLATFFVLNEQSLASIRAGRARHDFAHQGEGYRCNNLEQPEKAVAYHEEDVLGLLDRTGFELKLIRYGQWAGNSGATGQDIVVAS